MTNSAVTPEGLSVPEACVVAGVSRSTLYIELSKGSIKAKKLGGRTLILRSDLLEWLHSLPAAKMAPKAFPANA
jgi:excisionase family DNA binding protein